MGELFGMVRKHEGSFGALGAAPLLVCRESGGVVL